MGNKQCRGKGICEDAVYIKSFKIYNFDKIRIKEFDEKKTGSINYKSSFQLDKELNERQKYKVF